MKKILKASTKSGYNWILSARRNEGTKLSDIYGSFSARKENAINWCLNQFRSSKTSENFRIISHNSNFFTIAWEEMLENEPILHIETASNTYIVYLNR